MSMPPGGALGGTIIRPGIGFCSGLLMTGGIARIGLGPPVTCDSPPPPPPDSGLRGSFSQRW